MNAISQNVEPRAQRFATTTFTAFKLVDDLKGRCYPIQFEASPAMLEEAVNAGLLRCHHKDKLVVRETNELTGETRLHIYAVKKKSAPTRVYRDYAYHNVHSLYVEPVCVVPAEVLA